MLNRLAKSLVRTQSAARQRIADLRRRELARQRKRLYSFESLESRQLLAADIEIGLVDNTSSYVRTQAGTVATYTPVLASAQIGAIEIGGRFGKRF